MAASSVSIPSSRTTTLGFEDYSLYSGLSEDELIEMAIERSLAEAHASATQSGSAKVPALRQNPVHQNPCVRQMSRPREQNVPPPANPPSEKPFDKMGTIEAHFTTGSGRRMVRWRKYDGSLHVSPEPVEQADPLFQAIWDGNVRKVRELVKLSPKSMGEPYREGWIALHEAAYYGQVECLQILLRARPDMINKRSDRNQTPLFLAVSRNNVPCVEFLLENGGDPDMPNTHKETPLLKACERENAETVAVLLNHGALVNKPCVEGWTALHEAVCRNSVEICEMLVKAGAKVNARNMYGISPLFSAAQSGQLDSLRFLLKSGADINSQANDGATALYEASKNGHEEIVEFLLSQNADANRAAKCGFLPLHIAAERGNEGKRLLFKMTDNYCYENSVKIVSLLIPVTSKARIRRSGISPLHLAAERNKEDVLEVLIEAGYDVNAMLSLDRSKMYEDRRSTALYFAVINNNADATTMLLDAGANPNLDTFSPLLVALRHGCIQTVTLLVEHGANVNACVPTHPTSFPGTVMFCMKYLSLLKYLMDNGCDALSCFQCPYGNNPHPPIKIRSNRRNSLDDRNEDEAPKMPVLFCEMISTDLMSRWAGPIIDVLLDYVGNVQLCARLVEHLDSYEDWAGIKEKSVPPRPLMQLCRQTICSLVGGNRLRYLNTLPLPGRLIKFLKHEERYRDEDF
ncbi:ankyrin repeat and SOCS box protein 2-like [Conger conger]|uniref:ankyrin repeat and SOCS box protein 2-like n=1 Tax=Conger conger TaxID=82655 RepID=UPI002A59AFFD|nr:ankyrin repeat and SOCS box protein 2-like [Conger conger]XP_061099639.1 ankyrin repeat and SOCS box protein 2-like [Conger conger]